jgi:hypothetical protein
MRTSVTATPAITIRRTRPGDVPAIIAMLADDHLGAARERLEDPLPAIMPPASASSG